MLCGFSFDYDAISSLAVERPEPLIVYLDSLIVSVTKLYYVVCSSYDLKRPKRAKVSECKAVLEASIGCNS